MDNAAVQLDARAVAARIDLAYLKVDRGASVEGLRHAAELALGSGFRSLCLPPVLAGTVKKAYPQLRVSAAVSYPLGMDSLAAKVFACQELAEQGIDELDVVLDLFALLNGNRKKTEQEARELVILARGAGVFLKCIIEAPLLDDEKIASAVEVLCENGTDCIKTSTGYGRSPTTLEQVRLISQLVRGRCKVKASGGIGTLYEVRAMLEAGADIIGASAGEAILREAAG